MTAGERIKKVAEERGLSLRKVAIKAQIPYNTLYAIVSRKSNRVDIGTIQSIADALDVDIRYILGATDTINETEKENPPTPSNDDAEGDKVSEDAVEQALIQAGFIKPGQDLSDEDLKFLLSVGETIKAWFEKGNK